MQDFLRYYAKFTLLNHIGFESLMPMDYTDRPGEVADPWYTGDFERTYKDIYEGCLGLLEVLKNEKM